MKIYAAAYFATLLTFLAIDAIWLGMVAKNFYASQMGDLLRSKPNFTAAALFYIVYPFAITYLVLAPAGVAGSWVSVAIAGAVLGLASYGAYNLTNLAVIKGWPETATYTDWAWGTALTAIASLAGLAAMKYTA